MENYSTPKKMKKIGDLFERYRTHFKAPQATIEKACVEAILKVTGYKVDQKYVSYRVSTKTVHLQLPSILKSELRFKYNEILKEVKNIVGEKESPKTIL